MYIDKIGNSINGPITNAKDITGRSGKVTVAIARDIGEFLAEVVNNNDILSL
ncbi:hypothetical protein [Metaclostridioides mangenotii]|uniref:hypothetical protein n=1 Tax=Metaclostridioides mangenotii TaxID=1540 RepID=UPI0028EF73C2|nr:hypothetical protein [Clostridioides mangenotii]